MDSIGVYNSLSLTGVAAALASILGVEAPKEANPACEILRDLPTSRGEERVDRIVMFNPDAVGLEVFQKYTALFAPVLRHTQLCLPLRTVMPSVTPVCFGTMYTGALPEVHGIQAYCKPVIRIDTLFDSVLRSGKRAAIVADNQCSMGKIFLERAMDYYIYPTINEINDKALELIERDEHDFIAVYNRSFDANMHKHGPDAPESVAALEQNAATFEALAKAIGDLWKTKHTALLGFAPDHGCHEIDGGCGSHGLDMPSDLNIVHFYGVI